MIRNVIFDMGMVLIQWDQYEIIARFGVTGKDAEILRREVFHGFEWPAMDNGLMSADEVVRRVCRRLPEHLHSAAKSCVCDWWKGELIHTDGIEDLVRELKGLGYGLYVLSNATSDLHSYFDRLPAADCFDGFIVSADHELLKPDRELYEKLFEIFDGNYSIFRARFIRVEL